MVMRFARLFSEAPLALLKRARGPQEIDSAED
jgi:hypothetical protein